MLPGYKKPSPGPVLVHSDLMGAHHFPSFEAKQAGLPEAHVELLEAAVDRESLWFPTFNYRFLSSGSYDVESDPSQVGALTEHARRHWAVWRSDTPVFNYCSREAAAWLRDRISMDTTSGDQISVDPFGAGSMFERLHRTRGSVLLYGVGLQVLTAIHYVERLSGGPLYRYDKLFEGRVLYPGGQSLEIRFVYHVRPMGRSLDYDWPRLGAELLAAGELATFEVGPSRAWSISMEALVDTWTDRLARDPLYLLDAASRGWVEPELDRLGRRFEVADFEPPAPGGRS